jgi:hypothetical protein
MTHKCKSGQHTWIFKEDAEKCCNGFRRILVFNDPKKPAITWSWISCPAVCPMDTGGSRYDGFWLERVVRFFRYC